MDLDTRLNHPLTAMVSGQTGSGKTVWTRSFLRYFNTLTNHEGAVNVLWVYGQYQPVYNRQIENVNIRYTESFPDEEELTALRPTVVVIDDLMTRVADDVRLAETFTKLSHHLNISVVFIVQNLFYKGKYMRTISLNCHLIVLMNNIRDVGQMLALGRQIYPSDTSFFKAVLFDALKTHTDSKYPYLLINVQPGSDERTRLSTRVFPFESQSGLSQPIYYLK